MHERYSAGAAGHGNAFQNRTLRTNPWYWWCDPCIADGLFHDMDPWSGCRSDPCSDRCPIPGSNA